MADSVNVKTEQVDDIPVLLGQGKKIGMPELLDEHFMPHGNWQGTSFGWTTMIWLAHILSEGDHRLNQVEGWVEKRPHTLEISTGESVRALEWSDDRLGIVLDALADSENWKAFETELNRRTLRVYDLRAHRVRVDSTTASGYWTVTEEGLFQHGHSKDHRPDLPQLKVMLSALDPLGMPVATQVVSGERADDKLYIPAIQQVSASLDEHGLLYVGDCKMAALGTRAFIQNNQDYYLCPLSEVQLPSETLETYLRPVWSGKQTLIPIERENAQGQLEKIAEGYEQNVSLSAEMDGQTITWAERGLIVRSFQYMRASREGLHNRLAKAQAELLELNEHKQGKRQIEDRASMQTAAERILKHYRVVGLLKLNIVELQSTERHIRAYGDRPARTEIERTLTLLTELDDQAVQEAERWLGWRVYATNQPQDSLPLEKAILAYREEYLVERSFGRLKGKPLSLSPMYLQSDERATGLIHLLSIGLRILTLIEHQARQRLADLNEKLSGLYAGNPKRATDHPTAEAMLQAFKGIYLSVVILGDQVLYHMTPFSEVQGKILSLLDFSINIYSQLAHNFPKPTAKMTEP
jgi:transposase